VLEDPGDLAAREVGVDDQAGALAHQRLVPVGLQPVAELRGAAVLPDDRVVQIGWPVSRSQTTVVSRWLVMPMAATSRGRPGRGRAPRPPRDLRGPDLLRVVLDPAGLREDLRELLLGDRRRCAVVVEEDGAGAGRALIEGEDVRTL
jgi:hypothetical protein